MLSLLLYRFLFPFRFLFRFRFLFLFLFSFLFRIPDSRFSRRPFQRRCVHVYKCINGLINHDMDLIRQDVLYRHNTRNKGNFRLPRVKRNWGKQRTKYHAVSDFNSLSQTIKDSRNVNSFKRNVFKFLI